MAYVVPESSPQVPLSPLGQRPIRRRSRHVVFASPLQETRLFEKSPLLEVRLFEDMSLFKRRKQLAKVEHISPPSAPVLHAYPDQQLPASERAAKRRRIEDYAKDYLKGRPIHIVSAGLRGPFNDGWKSPWGKRAAKEKVHNERVEEHGHAVRADSDEEDDFLARRTRRRSNENTPPGSPEGSAKVQAWLRRQNVGRYSPERELEDQFDAEIRDGSPMVQRDQREDLKQRSNSLGDDGYRPLFGQRTKVVEETPFAKVSLIDENKFLGGRKKTGLKKALVPVDSPFFFRRGKRPTGKGSGLSKPSNDVLDVPLPEADVPEPIDDAIEIPEAASIEADAPQDEPVIPPEEPAMEQVEPQAEDVEPENDEVVTISQNAGGKWPCPMEDCENRPKPYASRSGLARHLKSKHDVRHTAVDKTRPSSRNGQQKQTGARAVSEPANTVDEAAGRFPEETAALEDTSRADPPQKTAVPEVEVVPEEAPGDVVVEPESIREEMDPNFEVVPDPVAPGAVDAETVSAQDKVVPEPETAPEKTVDREENTFESTATLQPESIDTGIRVPRTPEAEGQQIEVEATMEEAPIMPEESIADAQQPDTANPADLVKSAAASGEPSTELPDRQDSKAYSTFTYNPEQSTQAALQQARNAFVDTQSPDAAVPRRTSSNFGFGSNGAPQQSTQAALDAAFEAFNETQSPEEAASRRTSLQMLAPKSVVKVPKIVETPFKRPQVPTVSEPTPDSLFKAAPVNTQDLEDAAAELNFSTVKKKRISFADWGQAKASQRNPSYKVNDLSTVFESPDPFSASKDLQSPALSSNGTPTRSKPVAKKSNLSFSKVLTSSPTVVQQKSSAFFSTGQSAPSAAPIPSYQEAQHAQQTDSFDIDSALDDVMDILETGDVDKEIERNSAKKVGLVR